MKLKNEQMKWMEMEMGAYQVKEMVVGNWNRDLQILQVTNP
jgi:hypothetical protein